MDALLTRTGLNPPQFVLYRDLPCLGSNSPLQAVPPSVDALLTALGLRHPPGCHKLPLLALPHPMALRLTCSGEEGEEQGAMML